MNWGIILLKSLIDADKRTKLILKSLNLKKVNSYSKLDFDKFSNEMKYRLYNYAIWGFNEKYKDILKTNLHPIKGGHDKLKKFGKIDNFEIIFENMYLQKFK